MKERASLTDDERILLAEAMGWRFEEDQDPLRFRVMVRNPEGQCVADYAALRRNDQTWRRVVGEWLPDENDPGRLLLQWHRWQQGQWAQSRYELHLTQTPQRVCCEIRERIGGTDLSRLHVPPVTVGEGEVEYSAEPWQVSDRDLQRALCRAVQWAWLEVLRRQQKKEKGPVHATAT